jgi:hypothetical protein
MPYREQQRGRAQLRGLESVVEQGLPGLFLLSRSRKKVASFKQVVAYKGRTIPLNPPGVILGTVLRLAQWSFDSAGGCKRGGCV